MPNPLATFNDDDDDVDIVNDDGDDVNDDGDDKDDVGGIIVRFPNPLATFQNEVN